MPSEVHSVAGVAGGVAAGVVARDSAGAVGDLPDFAEAVLDLVDHVPEGRVVTYGDVAEMIGGSGPRRVGNVLSRYGAATSWWRVVRAGGHPPMGLEDEALRYYRSEGTPLVGGALSGRRVDLMRARWDGPAASGAPEQERDAVGDP